MNTSTPKLIELKEIQGNPPIQLDPVQQLMAPHVDAFIAFWVAVWCITLFVLLVKVTREYIEYRKNRRR